MYHNLLNYFNFLIQNLILVFMCLFDCFISLYILFRLCPIVYSLNYIYSIFYSSCCEFLQFHVCKMQFLLFLIVFCRFLVPIQYPFLGCIHNFRRVSVVLNYFIIFVTTAKFFSNTIFAFISPILIFCLFLYSYVFRLYNFSPIGRYNVSISRLQVKLSF